MRSNTTIPPPDGAAATAADGPLRVRLAWIAALAFSSGFPFGFFNDLVPVFLRARGVSLADIGFLSTLALPWALKFLWAPLVDRVATRRRWIAASQVGLALALIGLVLGGSATITTYAAILLIFVALSATQDIAVDAYTIEVMDRRELGPANGVRVTAYRAGMIVAGGALVGLSASLGWNPVLLAGSALFVALAALTMALPDHKPARTEREPLLEPLRELAARPALAGAFVFVLTFKLGDLALIPMVKPFWLDSGYSVGQIGWVQTTLGIAASIVGALTGGAATRWLGTFRALWMLGLIQALSNLGYYAAAVAGAPPALMYGAAVTEQFTGGLGTAAFLTFLMTLCSKRNAATQFALLSALYRVGGIAAAAVSGLMAEQLGYASFFLVTFGLALPGFLLLPFVRRTLAQPIAEPARAPDE